MERLYENIKSICHRKHMTVFDLEEKAGMPYNSLTRWKKVNPGVENVKNVADVLEVTVDELLKE